MRLTIFNGSPRGHKSNTKFLLDHFIKGFASKEGNAYELMYLNSTKDSELHFQFFEDADVVLIAFPLYVDSMPSLVKGFIEALEPLCGRRDNPAICFFVHSGFMEAVHSHYIERYLKRLADRLGSPYLGTIIKGGTEGVQFRADKPNKGLFNDFYQLGKKFGESGQLDATLLNKISQPVQLRGLLLLIVKIVERLGIFNKGWDKMLKANNAWEQRNDRPFQN